jgi:hypothetical protein
MWGEVRTEFLVGNVKERSNLEDLGIYGRMFKKYDWTCGLNSCDSGLGEVVGFCKAGNEPFGSIKV